MQLILFSASICLFMSRTNAIRLAAARIIRRPLALEFLIILAFLGLTIVMTWPWILHLRSATPGPGDPYLISWILWWDYHQTFHSPFNLFHANIFYPYRYTLAFSEHHYGIALFCFPFFALGLQPLTVQGIATLLGFALSGYCAFRLARTLTGSNGIAWIAGIVFAFIPYRFSQLPHLVYLWAASIPLLLEAFVLFLRAPTRRRAAWFAFAFFLNGISSVHWLLMTLIPLGLSAVLLVLRHSGWRDVNFWRRGLLSIACACVALFPFLWPYYRAAKLYGFVRNAEEARFYSAQPIDWLVGIYGNRTWHLLNDQIRAPERELFPGFLPPLLALAAIFLISRAQTDAGPGRKWQKLVLALDVMAIAYGVLIVIVSGYGNIKLRLFGFQLISISDTAPLIAGFFLALMVRLCIAYPEVIRRRLEPNVVGSLRSKVRSEALWLGMIWTVTGFIGSLGMNFFFHRFLFRYITVFRSIRVPARWAMICYLGLALLAGLGAKQFVDLISRHYKKFRPALGYVVLAAAILCEQNAAPIGLFTGAVDADALTLRFRQTPMRGGIVELPFADNEPMDFVYVLRAADHGRPLVTAVSGFMPPIQKELELITHSEPVPDRFIDLLESIPCSYLVIHNEYLAPSNRAALEFVLKKALSAGRVRFIRSYDESDLYAVIKTEPEAKSEERIPTSVLAAGISAPVPARDESAAGPSNPIDDPEFFTRMQYVDFLGREPDRGGLNYWVKQIVVCGNAPACIDQQRARVSAAFFETGEFQQTDFFVYCVYKATLGRTPAYAEFVSDRARLAQGPDLETARTKFIDEWTKRAEFTHLYPSHLPADQFVDALIKRIAATSGVSFEEKRQTLINDLARGGSRATVIRSLVEDRAYAQAEHNRSLVLMQYFAYLKRDPEPANYDFWVEALDRHAPNALVDMVRSFINSNEYRARFIEHGPATPGRAMKSEEK